MNEEIRRNNSGRKPPRRTNERFPIAVLLGGIVLIALLLSVIVLGKNGGTHGNASNTSDLISGDVSLEGSVPDESGAPVESGPDESDEGDTPSSDESEKDESFYYESSYDMSAEAPDQEFENVYDFSLSAQYSFVYDITNDKVLYANNASDRAYPASITKLMTSIIALKYCDPNDVFTAGEELGFVIKGSSLAMIYRGQRLRLSMLIDAMMLPSGNDAAYIVAANAGRKIADDETLSAADAVSVFIDKMNQEAERLGCRGTHFANPDGFHDDRHFTTAYDLALIAEEALSYEVIRKSVLKEKVDAVYESGEMMTWINSNYLIRYDTLSTADREKWHSEYATGLKTGTTSQAGSCMVASAKKGNREIVAVLLKCRDGMGRYEDAHEIIDTIFD